MKKLRYIFAAILLSAAVFCPSCTNLDETVYSSVMSNNYYHSRQDVINATFRPFEHFFETTYHQFKLQELSADQIITPGRGSFGYYDGGKWERYHRHQYQDITEAAGNWSDCWNSMYAGIAQCNLVLDDIGRLDHSKFEISEAEWDSFTCQLKCMRCYAYINLLDFFRNCILTTTSDQAINELPENRKQVPPEKLFEFIETELLECLELLPTKSGNSGNGIYQGQFNKAVAAAMLVKLYLNAEVWIGVPKWQECMDMADRILGGEFGFYALDADWFGPFDWNNEKSNEVIFAFPSKYGQSCWHTQNSNRTIYGRCLPIGCSYYLEIEGDGTTRNPEFALSPSYDNSYPRKEFKYGLGMVTRKFAKYPGDVRYTQYKNTTINTREGMFFLEGTIPGKNGSPYQYNGYDLYLLDQVGTFEDKAAEGRISNSSKAASTLGNGDLNSGLYCVKYPFYPYNGGYYCESDETIFRLAEVIYSKAECLLRTGKASDAGKLLNSVRKRNYVDFNANIAYAPEGNVVLDEKEMLDEWGREFLEEGRRRMDLIRFGRFTEEWWDKPADADDHCQIYPLSQEALAQNPYLVQNPGYPSISK